MFFLINPLYSVSAPHYTLPNLQNSTQSLPINSHPTLQMISDRTKGWVLWAVINSVILYIISFILIHPFAPDDSSLRLIYPQSPYIFFKLAAYIQVTVLAIIGFQFGWVLWHVDDKHFRQPTKKNFTEPS